MTENRPHAPLLSFGIITCNQPAALTRLLLNLVPQLTPEVEVVIRDDSANDETERAVAPFLSHGSIRYFHMKKEGVDRAILFLVEAARGRYFWGFGDDTLADDAIAVVLGVLREHPDITLLLTNCRTVGKTGSEFAFGGSAFFRSGGEVLERFADLLDFISIAVYDRGRAIPGIPGARAFDGSTCATLYLEMYVLSQPGRFYYLDHACVVSGVRVPNATTWYNPFQVFGIDMYRVVMSFAGRFPKRTLKRMVGKTFGSVWRSILVYRAKGYENGFGSDAANVRALFPLYRTFPEFWLALPLLLLPRPLLRVAYRAYKVLHPETSPRFR